MTNPTQPTKPGDVFGQCPKCGEMWERHDDQWDCDHCGFKLNLAAAPALLAALTYALSVLESMPVHAVTLTEDVLDEAIDYDRIKAAIREAEGN